MALGDYYLQDAAKKGYLCRFEGRPGLDTLPPKHPKGCLKKSGYCQEPLQNCGRRNGNQAEKPLGMAARKQQSCLRNVRFCWRAANVVAA